MVFIRQYFRMHGLDAKLRDVDQMVNGFQKRTTYRHIAIKPFKRSNYKQHHSATTGTAQLWPC